MCHFGSDNDNILSSLKGYSQPAGNASRRSERGFFRQLPASGEDGGASILTVLDFPTGRPRRGHRSGGSPIPTGSRPPAQGCGVAATLGPDTIPTIQPQRRLRHGAGARDPWRSDRRSPLGASETSPRAATLTVLEPTRLQSMKYAVAGRALKRSTGIALCRMRQAGAEGEAGQQEALASRTRRCYIYCAWFCAAGSGVAPSGKGCSGPRPGKERTLCQYKTGGSPSRHRPEDRRDTVYAM